MRHALAAACLLLAACGRPPLSADIEVPYIGVTLPAQQFPASFTTDPTKFCAPAPQSVPPCVQVVLDYDLGAQVPALKMQNVTYDLRMTEVAITLSSAGDMSGVKSGAVLVRDLATGAETVVASYTRPAGATGPISAVSVYGDAGVDLGPYLTTGRLPVRVQLVMDGTTPAFAADVRAAFSIVIRVNWGSYL